MKIDFEAREKEVKNSYQIIYKDGQFIIMEKDFYFSEVLNDFQDYWKVNKEYKTLKGAVARLSKMVIQHFPANYFDNNDIDSFINTIEMNNQIKEEKNKKGKVL